MKKYRVQSSNGKKFYTVIDNETFLTCSCKSHQFRKTRCKHIKAVIDYTIENQPSDDKNLPFGLKTKEEEESFERGCARADEDNGKN